MVACKGWWGSWRYALIPAVVQVPRRLLRVLVHGNALGHGHAQRNGVCAG